MKNKGVVFGDIEDVELSGRISCTRSGKINFFPFFCLVCVLMKHGLGDGNLDNELRVSRSSRHTSASEAQMLVNS